ncbi:C40 family peptidase [Streptomyces sp. NPDC001667]
MILACGAILASAPAVDADSASEKALQVAASKQGSWYQWGATGPRRFDCSGLVFYSFSKSGKRLPRTAQAQYDRVSHVSRSNRRPGDLVFFHSHRYVHHVGIYAGQNQMWHAPHTGSRVRLEKIWTADVWYGRADD